jgi:hypothetical protein
VLDSCFQGKGGLLEQPEDFEDNHDNDNHSNYVKDISAHVGNSYQIARAMINIYLNLVCRGTFRIISARFGQEVSSNGRFFGYGLESLSHETVIALRRCNHVAGLQGGKGSEERPGFQQSDLQNSMLRCCRVALPATDSPLFVNCLRLGFGGDPPQCNS